MLIDLAHNVLYTVAMKQRRLRNGKYRINYFDRLFPLYLMLLTAGLSWGLQTGNKLRIQQVQARGGDNASWVELANATTPTPTPQLDRATIVPIIMPTATPTPTDKEAIIAEIVRVFGEEAPNAFKIVECESMWNPKANGDKNLMAYHSGELVGDSIGLFQIRTGGRDFNRAKANGMTADEFRQAMFNPIKNIRYAKTIYNQRGWSAWSCSSKL